MTNEQIKNTIKDTFNEVSSKYDANKFFNITAKEMVKKIPKKENLKILDLSTGTGIVAIETAKNTQKSTILAVDLSKGMLEIAQNKARKENITNIKFEIADVEQVNYEEKSFDILTCGFALFFYPNMEDTFNSLCKLIKKDGKFIFTSFTQDAFNPYSELFFKTMEKDYGHEYPARGSSLLNTHEYIKDFVNNQKPLDYNIEEIEIEYPISVNQWWELLNSAGYKTLLNKLSQEDLIKFKKQHLDDITKLSIDSKIQLKVNTYITTINF